MNFIPCIFFVAVWVCGAHVFPAGSASRKSQYRDSVKYVADRMRRDSRLQSLWPMA